MVNTASRLQGAAPVGGVLAGPGTYAATRRVFDYEPLAPVVLKGKAEPVAVFRRWRRGPGRHRGDPVARHAAGGRQIDLRSAPARFRKGAESAVQLVVVAGEPGVGKARLVAELSRS